MGGKFLKIGIFVAAVVGMVSCNNIDNQDEQRIIENEQAIEKYIADSSLSLTKDNNGFYYKITRGTSSDEVKVGEEVTVKYDIYLLSGLKVWTSVKDTVKTVKFPAFTGAPFVVPAMELGINLMRAGDKATILSPYYIGFGNYTSILTGYNTNATIPQYSPIRVEMELVSKRTEVQQIDNYLTANKLVPTYRTSDNLIVVKTAEVATGDTIGPNKVVKVKYVGKLLNGTVFDEGKEILQFTTGTGNSNLITGFDRAIRKMKVNEKATIILPSATAYGKGGRANSQGSNYVIKPYEPILFNVEVQP